MGILHIFAIISQFYLRLKCNINIVVWGLLKKKKKTSNKHKFTEFVNPVKRTLGETRVCSSQATHISTWSQRTVHLNVVNSIARLAFFTRGKTVRVGNASLASLRAHRERSAPVDARRSTEQHCHQGARTRTVALFCLAFVGAFLFIYFCFKREQRTTIMTQSGQCTVSEYRGGASQWNLHT